MINDGIVVGDATGRKGKSQGRSKARVERGENVMINQRGRVYHLTEEKTGSHSQPAINSLGLTP